MSIKDICETGPTVCSPYPRRLAWGGSRGGSGGSVEPP